MNSMLLLSFLAALQLAAAAEPPFIQERDAAAQTAPAFRQVLERFATLSEDSCSPFEPDAPTAPTREDAVFETAGGVVVRALNEAEKTRRTALDRLDHALADLERESAAVNESWNGENRFHFTALDVSPILVLGMTFRGHASFAVFAETANGSGDGSVRWMQLGWDHMAEKHPAPYSSVRLYPLHRGPSGRARFLAYGTYAGCGGNTTGILYDAREWHGETALLDTILLQEGALGSIDAPSPFAPIGDFRVDRARITLPYCRFSPIDTWDNPNLCVVDTYDLSGDTVRFRSRVANRPDLLTIVQAVEYAGKRDLQAVRGYCGSLRVARDLVREPPQLLGEGEDPVVRRDGSHAERVRLGADPATEFLLARNAQGWTIVSFYTVPAPPSTKGHHGHLAGHNR